MALIAQLGEHCTGIAEVVGSNPAQSLKNVLGLCSSSVTAALALMTKKKVVGREGNSLTSCDSQNVNFLGLHPGDLKVLLIFLWR